MLKAHSCKYSIIQQLMTLSLEKNNYLYVYATNPVLSTDVATFFMIKCALVSALSFHSNLFEECLYLSLNPMRKKGMGQKRLTRIFIV